MLQQPTPEDYVIATGKMTSVREFIVKSFRHVGIELQFSGEGESETATITTVSNPDFAAKPGQVVLAVDDTYYRPTEVDQLLGDASKAKRNLGWEPKHSVDELIAEMMQSDMALFRREKYLRDSGMAIREL